MSKSSEKAGERLDRMNPALRGTGMDTLFIHSVGLEIGEGKGQILGSVYGVPVD